MTGPGGRSDKHSLEHHRQMVVQMTGPGGRSDKHSLEHHRQMLVQ
jgi:hypothetical protein